MTEIATFARSLWRRHYALPGEHGAWIWWLGPPAIGTAAAGRPGINFWVLLVGALSSFLLRQPATIAVKSLSSRRPKEDLYPAVFWAAACSILGLLSAFVLVRQGYSRLVWLALLGLPVFALHLWLVSKRAERGQRGVELVGAGVLALAAPAGYWVSGGSSDPEAWILWGLTWLQCAASIVFIYLRLEQRTLREAPLQRERWRAGARVVAYHIANVIAGAVLWIAGYVPWLVALGFGVMLIDALEGVAHPPVGAGPTRIGIRQLVMSLLFVSLAVLGYMTRG